ncbi:unnamed protein product, partial [Effrenium voratum]
MKRPAEQRRTGYHRALRAGGALGAGEEAAHSPDESLEIHSLLQRLSTSLRPNAAHLALLLTADAARRAWHDALQRLAVSGGGTLRTARMCGPVAQNSALKAVELPEAWPWSLQLLSQLEEEETADVVSFNSAMDGCSVGGRWKHSLHLLQAMQLRRCCPTLVSAHAACGACELWGRWRPALRLAEAAGALSDVVTFNTAMNACMHSKERGMDGGTSDEARLRLAWRGALRVHTQMRACRTEGDLVTVNLVASAYGAARRWEESLCWLLQSCTLSDVAKADAKDADEVTFGAVLGARFPRQLALQLLQTMKKQELEPNAVTHSAVVSACERDGDPQGAPGSLWGLEGAGSRALCRALGSAGAGETTSSCLCGSRLLPK